MPIRLSMLFCVVALCVAGCGDGSGTVTAVRGTVTAPATDRQAVAPLAGVTIACAGLTTTTAADGTYELLGLPPGQFTITAIATGYHAYGGSLAVTHAHATTRDIQLTPVVSGTPMGTVSGTVTQRVADRQAPTPLVGVTVACGGVSALSGVDGTYLLSGVPAGQLTLVASLPGYGAYAGVVTVPANQTANHDIQMSVAPAVQAPGNLAVTVRSAGDDLALAGVRVSCGGVSATTTADGTCTLSGVPGGQQVLTASAAGYQTHSAAVAVATGTTPVTITLVASGGVRVAVSPETLQAAPGERYAFHATVTGTLNGAVTWSVREGGAIDADGTLTAPSTPGTYHIDAVSLADISQSATATVTVVAVDQMIPFTGTRSYDVSGMAGGPLDGTGLQLTVTNQPSAGRRGRDANGLTVVVNSANGVFDQSLMTIEDVLQSYLAGTLTTNTGGTCSVEIRFLNGGDSLVIIIRFEAGPSTGTALKMLAVTATASAPQGFAVRRTIHFGGAALALVQGARVVRYEWDFDGDGTYDHSSDTTPEVDHVYTAAGSHPATLRVTDSGGGVASDTLNLTIVSGSTVVVVQ